MPVDKHIKIKANWITYNVKLSRGRVGNGTQYEYKIHADSWKRIEHDLGLEPGKTVVFTKKRSDNYWLTAFYEDGSASTIVNFHGAIRLRNVQPDLSFWEKADDRMLNGILATLLNLDELAVPNTGVWRYLQIVASIEQYSDLKEMTLEEAVGRLKTYEERIKFKKGKQVDNHDKLMFTRHENKGKYFRGRDENLDSHKKLGHIAPKCPLRTNTNEQSNLVEEDLEPTLLMATLEVEEQEVSLHKNDVGYKETNMDSLWYLDNEAIKQRKPNLGNLRIFGCIAYAKNTEELQLAEDELRITNSDQQIEHDLRLEPGMTVVFTKKRSDKYWLTAFYEDGSASTVVNFHGAIWLRNVQPDLSFWEKADDRMLNGILATLLNLDELAVPNTGVWRTL
ncbi:hypothetical protein Tco_0661850 [Tanacetum coccineum]